MPGFGQIDDPILDEYSREFQRQCAFLWRASVGIGVPVRRSLRARTVAQIEEPPRGEWQDPDRLILRSGSLPGRHFGRDLLKART